jgi:integrase
MKVSDVKPDSFIITKAKTPSGVRIVPMHNEITHVVERLKRTSTGNYLISGESHDNLVSKRSKGLSIRFGRLKTELGFKKNMHTFHSFRSTLAKRFESAGVEEILAARIIGHKVRSITYGVYSRGADWDILFETMNNYISYPRKQIKTGLTDY